MTRAVSTKVSDKEYEALLEMTSLIDQDISEFVRDSIVLRLCGSWKTPISDEKFQKIDALVEKNSKRFEG